MPSKQVTISARLSHEDAEFLSQIEINGAKTPSDKLRAIIAEARRRQSRSVDYAGCFQMIQEIILPVTQQIRQKEVENDTHSEVISRVAEWMPDALAFLISHFNQAKVKDDTQNMLQLEQGLVERVVRLMESFLQLAVTRHCPCYQPEVIQKKITPILDLCDIISSRQQSEKGA